MATGKPELGRGGLRSACQTGRACASLGLGVARGAWLLTLGEGTALQRVRVRMRMRVRVRVRVRV